MSDMIRIGGNSYIKVTLGNKISSLPEEYDEKVYEKAAEELIDSFYGEANNEFIKHLIEKCNKYLSHDEDSCDE